ncbi:DUF397 domain-containing protein [Spirillospora sp. NPDC048911]|uniref:DUF397 domain-containing protein n=1 Tax=Spirillospora sp. NPDC048911 TaxID=3364527 RepID=UPI003710FF92
MTVQWRKSSRSAAGEDKHCVELACLTERVGVRDSKAPEGGHLSIGADDWRRFIRGVKADRYDLPQS